MGPFFQKMHTLWNGYNRFGYWFSGAILLVAALGLTLLSTQFEEGMALKDKPIIILIGIMLVAGVAYALTALKAEKITPSNKKMIYLFLVGLFMRMLLLPSLPMLEDDFHRYLWDGAVAAHGYNPFAYAPQDVLDAIGNNSETIPLDIISLGKASNGVLKGINHPDLRTIYPPVAQFFFTVANWIRPWSLLAWRVVLGFCDIVILIILIFIVRRLHIPFMVLIIYWWNPLWIKEFYNSAHMDLVILPFLLGALLLAMKQRPLLSTVLIAFGCGAKVWPVLLLPVIWRPLLTKPKTLIGAVSLFLIVMGGLFWPIYSTGLDSDSGFTAYSHRWEMNDALFMAIAWICKKVVHLFGGSAQLGLTLARLVVMGLLGGFVWWINRRQPEHESEIMFRSAWIIAALFMVSPTQFPWYYGWVIPFLVCLRSPTLILMSIMLSLYYLRFYFKSTGQVVLFDQGVVWLEFVPVWCLLFWELRLRKQVWVREKTV